MKVFKNKMVLPKNIFEKGNKYFKYVLTTLAVRSSVICFHKHATLSSIPGEHAYSEKELC